MEGLCLVPRAGLEPARVLPHRFLRPTRLPIPPSGQGCFGSISLSKSGAKVLTFFDMAKFFLLCNENVVSLHH